MSMRNVEYQGYGVDLGNRIEFFKDSKFEDLMQSLVNGFDGVVDVSGAPDEYITACNTDSFEALVLIPAIIPVSLSSVHVYTEEQANEKLVEMINDAFKTLQEAYRDGYFDDATNHELEKVDFCQVKTNDFQAKLHEFVDEYADYSYERDWSDLI